MNIRGGGKMSKKVIISLMVFLLAGFVVGQNSFATIVDSLHDFSSRSWNSTGEICIVCHTPHKAMSTTLPLWNHTTTATTFQLYASPTLQATMEQPGPNSVSRACLSCHDGTVAIDSFGGRTGGVIIPAFFNLGTDLRDDHPISFTYDPALATSDGYLWDPTVKTVPSLGGQTIDRGMLVSHKLECSSCHDVHHNKGDAPITSWDLIVNNTRSNLCLTCHNK